MCDHNQNNFLNNNTQVPFEIKDVEGYLNSEYNKYFPEYKTYVRAGTKGYLLPVAYKQAALAIYTMPVRPSDIFILGIPRSGTTWTQELVWLVANDLDFATAKSVNLSSRYTFIDKAVRLVDLSPTQECAASPRRGIEEVAGMPSPGCGIAATASMPSPRFIKSHLPLSLLPELESARVVYVARDPRDVAFSSYNYFKHLVKDSYTGNFQEFLAKYITESIFFCPYFEHVKEAWERRHHPNMLFLFYEELTQDLATSVRRVATFLGKQCSPEAVRQLCEHLHIDRFRHNTQVNNQYLVDSNYYKCSGFIGKGGTGAWRAHCDAAAQAQAAAWIARNLRGSDLRFPRMEPYLADLL